MKQLVTALSNSGFESPVCIKDNLEDAIEFVKKQTIMYFGSSMKIYSLEHPLTVRYLDNKIFID